MQSPWLTTSVYEDAGSGFVQQSLWYGTVCCLFSLW
ncbi:MAG: hypothetical protein RIQ53_4571 [Pseudomonadota bacterium]|jgi:hypothetical protein